MTVSLARSFFNGNAVTATVYVAQPAFFGFFPAVPSAPVPVDLYLYTYYQYPVGTDGAPDEIIADAAGRVWIESEFHTTIKCFDPAAPGITSIAIPLISPDNHGPYWNFLTGVNSNSCEDGEAVAIDATGRVWFPEGGGEPPTSVSNHSRIISYTPLASGCAGGTMNVYNVPGNDARVSGITVDPGLNSGPDDDRVWFEVQGRRETVNNAVVQTYGQRLVAFSPKYVSPNANFDYVAAAANPANACNRPNQNTFGYCQNVATRKCLSADDCVLAEQICPDNVVYDYWCFHEYPIMQTTWPPDAPQQHAVRHLLAHPTDYSGYLAPQAVWFAEYGSETPGLAFMGRLDPTYGAVRTDVYPLATRSPVYTNIFPIGPWDIRLSHTNDVITALSQEAMFARFHFAQKLDPACKTVNKPATTTKNVNPCIDQLFVPGKTGRCSGTQSQPGTCSNLPTSSTRTCTTDLDCATASVHGLWEDAGGKLWFTEEGSALPLATGASPSVGYVKSDWSGVVLFPTPSLYSDANGCANTNPVYMGFYGAGITVVPNGDVFFADFCRKRLGKLHKV